MTTGEIVFTYKVYAKLNENNIITAVNSSAFLSEITGWMEIDEGTGDKHYHAQGNYLPLGLVDENGMFNYKYVDGELVERTAEEKNAEALPLLIEQKKAELISESKIRLAQWLADNPLLFTDGKYYSVTEEKQTLLNSNLASYERAVRSGLEYPLKWNSTGEQCVEWLYQDLLMLSLSIAAYVAPKVAIQQAAELRIKECTTLEECEAVVIDYT